MKKVNDNLDSYADRIRADLKKRMPRGEDTASLPGAYPLCQYHYTRYPSPGI
jgi:hypothetical protein